MNKNILIIMALNSESQGYFKNENIIYTGVGKVNASYGLMKAISENRPKRVINLGSAGSSFFKKGELVNCAKFVERDMNATALGFKNYVTPFEDGDKQILEYGNIVPNLPAGICGTGDNFHTASSQDIYNVVDMESYAIAKICKLQKMSFTCIKYITDGADSNASDDWNKSLSMAAKNLFAEYKKLLVE